MINIISDYRSYKLNIVKFIVGFVTFHIIGLNILYRTAFILQSNKVPILPGVLHGIGIMIYGADISPKAKIGKGFRISHSVGIVIGPNVIIGDNFQCFQNVTIGGRDRAINKRTMPIIGDNVTVFSGAVVIGPITIGDNVSIGANSVVTKDIDANLSVAGVPAKTIGKIDVAHSLRSLK